jgi:hypothetical protein
MGQGQMPQGRMPQQMPYQAQQGGGKGGGGGIPAAAQGRMPQQMQQGRQMPQQGGGTYQPLGYAELMQTANDPNQTQSNRDQQRQRAEQMLAEANSPQAQQMRVQQAQMVQSPQWQQQQQQNMASMASILGGQRANSAQSQQFAPYQDGSQGQFRAPPQGWAPPPQQYQAQQGGGKGGIGASQAGQQMQLSAMGPRPNSASMVNAFSG